MTITTSTVGVYVALLLLMSWRLTVLVAAGMLADLWRVVRLLTGQGVVAAERSEGVNPNSRSDDRRDRRDARHPCLRSERRAGPVRSRPPNDCGERSCRNGIRRRARASSPRSPGGRIPPGILFWRRRSARDVTSSCSCSPSCCTACSRGSRTRAHRACASAALSSSVEEVSRWSRSPTRSIVRSGSVHPEVASIRDIVFDRVSFRYYPPGDDRR